MTQRRGTQEYPVLRGKGNPPKAAQVAWAWAEQVQDCSHRLPIVGRVLVISGKREDTQTGSGVFCSGVFLFACNEIWRKLLWYLVC